VSGIAVLLFLGGWHTGVVPGHDLTDFLGPYLGNVINATVFIVKCWLLVFVMMWVRWTLPRLRIDQVMETCLKYLLPISCGLLLGVALWQGVVPGLLLDFLKYAAALACLALVLFLVVKVWTTRSRLPFAGVTPMWKPA